LTLQGSPCLLTLVISSRTVVPTSPVCSCAQMITWSAWSQTRFTDTPGNHTLSAVTDLTTLKSTLVDVTNIAHDMFCPGARH